MGQFCVKEIHFLLQEWTFLFSGFFGPNTAISTRFGSFHCAVNCTSNESIIRKYQDVIVLDSSGVRPWGGPHPTGDATVRFTVRADGFAVEKHTPCVFTLWPINLLGGTAFWPNMAKHGCAEGQFHNCVQYRWSQK